DDIRGQGPGDLVEGGRETSLNVRQGDIEDRIVETLHDIRQHDRDSDHAAVRNRGERVAPHRLPSKRKANRRTGCSLPSTRVAGEDGFMRRLCHVFLPKEPSPLRSRPSSWWRFGT